MVREAVLKTKDPKRILDEIEKIETFEIDAGAEPLPNDKALKDKKKKLRETLERLQKLYEKDDPRKAGEIQKLLDDSDQRRQHAYLEAYESKRVAEMMAMEYSDIPLPTGIPLSQPGVPMPSDIPLPGALPGQQTLPPGLIPPGPPPGDPPVQSGKSIPPGVAQPGPPPGAPTIHPPGVGPEDLGELGRGSHGNDDDSDSGTSESGLDEDEYNPEVGAGYGKTDTGADDSQDSDRPRSVRFADEVEPAKGDGSTSSVQKALLKIAGQADQANRKPDNRQATPGPPPGAPPGPPPRGMPQMGGSSIQPNFPIRPPPNMMENPPRMFPPGPPPGRPPGPPPGMPGGLPPGPPPGMPPNMAGNLMNRGPRPLMQQPMMPPGGPPPRMMRPPGPPTRMMPPPQGAVLSAPPSVISKPPMAMGDGAPAGILKKEGAAIIYAKPQIRNTQAELTKLVPTSLRIKREAPKTKGKSKEAEEQMMLQPQQPSHPVTGKATKDDAYAQFMREMEGLL
ncbi:WW domain-binding protein 11 isoform X2 [Nematostella vectensis]|nr:WW domain-binding protein 11 isoform X2 [Nematostella vectensis]